MALVVEGVPELGALGSLSDQTSGSLMGLYDPVFTLILFYLVLHQPNMQAGIL